jgi:hypothetical protein
MVTSSIHRRLQVAFTGAVLAVALAVPAAVSADTTSGVPSIPPAVSRDATIHVTSISVTAKIIATVTVDFTCQPFQSYDWQTGETVETTVGRVEGGQVTVIQAQGRTIAWGENQLFGPAATCDGSTVNTLSTPVTAAVTPWKVGMAVVGASIHVTDEFGSDSASANSGPVVVRLANR